MLKQFFLEDAANLRRLLNSDLQSPAEAFESALVLCCKALKNGNKIIAFGNGGSASDADHLVGELLGRFGYDRAPLPAVALSGASAAFTAIANDYGYEIVFERQLRGLGRAGDIAVGITTSGNSKNVVLALRAANELGLHTIALTGAASSKASETATVTLRAPSRETPRIQEIHAVLIHSLCRGIEVSLFPRKIPALPSRKILHKAELTEFAEALASRKSVFTNGCFDILHAGHVSLLQQARSLGDLLILGLNTDESVRALKGPERPFHCFKDRALVLSALSCVDFIIGFSEETPIEIIKQLTPKVLVKGGDYTPESIVGADWVTSNGGEVRAVPLVPGHSTTGILGRKSIT